MRSIDRGGRGKRFSLAALALACCAGCGPTDDDVSLRPAIRTNSAERATDLVPTTRSKFAEANANVPDRNPTNLLSAFSQKVFEAQVGLARKGISPGSIDGLLGGQTRAALRVFQ